MDNSDSETAPTGTVVVMTNDRHLARVYPAALLVVDGNKEANLYVFRSRWGSYHVLSRLRRPSTNRHCSCTHLAPRLHRWLSQQLMWKTNLVNIYQRY